MNNQIFEIITQSLTEDRISRIIDCDEEYQRSKLHEQVAHDKLAEVLTDNQKEMLNNLTRAAGETNSNAERIIYQQGMRDLFALLMALS